MHVCVYCVYYSFVLSPSFLVDYPPSGSDTEEALSDEESQK